jgi:hypothetical protein
LFILLLYLFLHAEDCFQFVLLKFSSSFSSSRAGVFDTDHMLTFSKEARKMLKVRDLLSKVECTSAELRTHTTTGTGYSRYRGDKKGPVGRGWYPQMAD